MRASMLSTVMATLLVVLTGACATQAPQTSDGGGVAVQSTATEVTGGQLDTEPGTGARLAVVATTTLVGDIARQVGGDAIDLTVMLPPGADPHAFEPSPTDIAAVADADVVFINGLGLEQFIAPMIEHAGGEARVVEVSEGIDALEFSSGELDPHVWFDPGNVMTWSSNISQALAELDPANTEQYEANAAALRADLEDLDGWIHEQVSMVPEDQRMLVTDHRVFGYFARRYGFEQVGTLLPGVSAMAVPSAAELSQIEDTIRELGVRAIFVGTTVNPNLAERVAEDTGVRVVTVYTGSLSEPDGPAATYDDFMRYDVSAIVEALRGNGAAEPQE